MIQARSYQTEAVSSLYEYFASNSGNPVIAMPTGTGKSVVIALFLESIYRHYYEQKVLVLTHVKELIQQNYAELVGMWPGAPAGINSAGLGKRDVHNRIVFAGIASVAKLAPQFGRVDLVLIDECHLVSPEDTTMYRKFIAALKAMNPQLKVIGLSATPYRLGQGKVIDEGGLFTDICFDITGLESFNRLIAEGYLAPLITKGTRTMLDVDGVHMRGGDFIQSELQVAVNKDEVTRAALQEALEKGGDRKHWLIFASGTDHADTIAAMLTDMGEPCVSVHSKSKTRDQDIIKFKTGQVRVCANNNVLTTGFNFKCIDLILMLRPTASPGLWVQMLGRGTRPCNCGCGKRDCLVLDYAGNVRRLGPINDPVIPRKKGEGGGPAPYRECDNIVGGETCKTCVHPSVKVCPTCDYVFPVTVKIVTTSSNEDVLKGDMPVVETFNVEHVTYSAYCKVGKPPSIRVTYYCGLAKFNEYVCLQHEGYAARKARLWWKERSEQPVPKTTEEALHLVDQVRVATHLRVWTNKQDYPEIMGHCYDGTAFGAQQASDSYAGPSIEVAAGAVMRPGAAPPEKVLGTKPSAENYDDDIPF